MSAADDVLELLGAIAEAFDATPALVIEDHRRYTQPFPGQRRPRKPWRIGIDATLCAILQIEGVDAAWMPLVGSSGADALETIADSINAHAGIEIEPTASPAALSRVFTDADAAEFADTLATR
ncbi:MAG: hypothetical protein ACI9U2_002508 [Bradymonadia bacterium]